MTANPNPNVVSGGDHPLEPINPQEAVDWYLDARASELAQQTLYAHTTRLRHFTDWCEEAEFTEMNEMGGRQIQRFSAWRKNHGISKETLRSTLYTFKAFLKWAETIHAVYPRTHELVNPPQLNGKEGIDERYFKHDHADAVLGHLSKFEYASFRHTLIEVLWTTGMRIGAAYALDVDDYDSEKAKLRLRHRPDEDTPLKNKYDGERDVALREKTCLVIDAYLEYHRPNTTDAFGREPFFASKQGRRSISNMRKNVYIVTQPCYYGPCPIGNTPETCEFTQDGRRGSCPENVHPHAIRKGAITWARNNDVPPHAVSDRMNVSPQVLEEVYYQASEDEKMRSRRDYFDNL